MTSPPPGSAFELHAGALRAAFRPDLGGVLAGLWHDHVAVLRSTEPAALVESRAAAMYPLLPYSNRLGYRRFRWRGHDHTTRANVPDMPHSLHGLGWQRPWRIAASSAVDLVLALDHAGDDDWPYAFAAEQGFSLSPDRIVCRLAVTNTDEREQPVGLGWHPYVLKRPRSRLHVEVDGRWDTDATQLPTRKVAQHGIDADVAHLDFDNAFDGWTGAARIRDERYSIRITSTLARLVVYTPQARDYFSVEPVSHVPNAIHMADPLAHGLVALAPEQTLRAEMEIAIAPV